MLAIERIMYRILQRLELKFLSDVSIQDQHSQLNSVFFARQLGATTLAVSAVVNSTTLTMTAGHGIVVGNCIRMNVGEYMYQSTVINVATNVITVARPLSYAYSSGTPIVITSLDMNVNGSVTPVTFSVNPFDATIWDVTRITFYIEDDVAMDTHRFGGITELTRGVVLRKKETDALYANVFHVTKNGDFELHSGEAKYQDKAPAGLYGLVSKHTFAGQHNFGVVFRISSAQELQLIVQDDLSALSYFRAVVSCHNVVD